MNGNFDYNRMPLAPMGCPVQVHVKSKDRRTFDFHSEPGFYLFTSPDHYQVHNNVMTKTKAERLSDSVVFQHGKIGPSMLTNATLVIKALALFLESIKGVTKGFRKAALKNGVNMRDIERYENSSRRLMVASKAKQCVDRYAQGSRRLVAAVELLGEGPSPLVSKQTVIEALTTQLRNFDRVWRPFAAPLDQDNNPSCIGF